MPGGQDLITEPEDGIARPSERTLHVCDVTAEPVDPTAHGCHARVILSILIVRGNDIVQYTRDGLRILVLMRDQAIRKFIMVGMAARAT